MARSNGRYRGRRSNEPRIHRPSESERTHMLNLGRISTFRYGIREILSHYQIDEATASSLIASVIAKGSRMSIDSARTFVRDQERAGMCPKAATDEICDLLEKFSRYR
ncbi:MAG: hypothetical protein WAS24_08950 [Thermoplasmata archaeon]